MDNYQNPLAEQLAYDLRQRYAKIVGDHLEDIAIHRKERSYSEYFRALEDLYVIVAHKFKEGKKDYGTKEGKKIMVPNIKKDKKDYRALKEDLINISNKYPDTWNGSTDNPKQIAEIENALRAIEMFLYSEMDRVKMFGGKRDQEGLI